MRPQQVDRGQNDCDAVGHDDRPERQDGPDRSAQPAHGDDGDEEAGHDHGQDATRLCGMALGPVDQCHDNQADDERSHEVHGVVGENSTRVDAHRELQCSRIAQPAEHGPAQQIHGVEGAARGEEVEDAVEHGDGGVGDDSDDEAGAYGAAHPCHDSLPRNRVTCEPACGSAQGSMSCRDGVRARPQASQLRCRGPSGGRLLVFEHG